MPVPKKLVDNLVIALILPLALLTAPSLQASDMALELSPENTKITFLLDATGHDVKGSLQLASGNLHFDPAAGTVSGEVTIDATSTESGHKKRDKTIHKKVLESEAYPNIVFRPERIEGTLSMQGMSKVTLHGTITMHGDEHPLALPSQVTIEDKTLNITSTFNVPYVEWGMHNPSMFILRVAKEVAVTIKASVPIESAVSAP